jgi:hypothetical protein
MEKKRSAVGMMRNRGMFAAEEMALYAESLRISTIYTSQFSSRKPSFSDCYFATGYIEAFVSGDLDPVGRKWSLRSCVRHIWHGNRIVEAGFGPIQTLVALVSIVNLRNMEVCKGDIECIEIIYHRKFSSSFCLLRH